METHSFHSSSKQPLGKELAGTKEKKAKKIKTKYHHIQTPQYDSHIQEVMH
jgi:hypothetical protein